MSAWPIQPWLADQREVLQGAYDHLLQCGEEQLSARSNSVNKAQTAYDKAMTEAVAEKQAARAPLMARVERLLGSDTLAVLADPPLEKVDEALFTPDLQRR